MKPEILNGVERIQVFRYHRDIIIGQQFIDFLEVQSKNDDGGV